MPKSFAHTIDQTVIENAPIPANVLDLSDLEHDQGPEADRLRHIFDIEDATAPKKQKRVNFVRFKADE